MQFQRKVSLFTKLQQQFASGGNYNFSITSTQRSNMMIISRGILNLSKVLRFRNETDNDPKRRKKTHTTHSFPRFFFTFNIGTLSVWLGEIEREQKSNDQLQTFHIVQQTYAVRRHSLCNREQYQPYIGQIIFLAVSLGFAYNRIGVKCYYYGNN